jgi:hypothetical protein
MVNPKKPEKLSIFSQLFLFVFFLTATGVVGFYTMQANYPQTFGIFFPTTNFLTFLHLSTTDFAKALGQTDMASYVRFANFLMEKNYAQLPYYLKTWPPALPFIIIVISKLTGITAYPLKMFLLNVITWSLAFLFVYHSLINAKNTLLRILLSLLPLILASFRLWIFGDGLFLTESISLPLFVIATCLFLRWLESQQLSPLLGMTATFFVLAFFRDYLQTFASFLIIMLALWILWCNVKLFWRNNKTSYKIHALVLRNEILKKNNKNLIIASIVFLLLLLPWRIYLYQHTGSMSWGHQGVIWQNFWDPTFFTYYKDGTIPCLIEPKICNILYQYNIKPFPYTNYEFYRNLSLMTLLTHPLQWYGIKIRYFHVFWFGTSITPTFHSWHDLLTKHLELLLEGVLIFFVGIIALLGCYYYQRKTHDFFYKGLTIFTFLFIIFNFLVFSIYHFEPRYSLYLRIYFLYLPCWVWFGHKKPAT